MSKTWQCEFGVKRVTALLKGIARRLAEDHPERTIERIASYVAFDGPKDGKGGLPDYHVTVSFRQDSYAPFDDKKLDVRARSTHTTCDDTFKRLSRAYTVREDGMFNDKLFVAIEDWIAGAVKHKARVEGMETREQQAEQQAKEAMLKAGYQYEAFSESCDPGWRREGSELRFHVRGVSDGSVSVSVGLSRRNQVFCVPARAADCADKMAAWEATCAEFAAERKLLGSSAR
jgi:hypothetical protein